MNKAAVLVKNISRHLDKLAGLCIVAVMMLVVSNVLLRTIFHRPILGTYEYVTLLTAVGIGLALAYCAFQNGHIAVDFIIERFPPKMQAFIDIFTNIIALGFWTLSAWYVAQYAMMMMEKNMVTPTTQIPLAPVVFLIACGLWALSMVVSIRLSDSIRRAVR